jgi:hypothetical protein
VPYVAFIQGLLKLKCFTYKSSTERYEGLFDGFM